MSNLRTIWGALAVLCTVTTMASIPAFAQPGQKPNILFIMGDDIGWMQKTALSIGGSLGSPSSAFLYDWNMLPIGQQLWLAHLLSYEKYPPLQAPESYNLSGVIEEVKKANSRAASD